ncbi:hypothetical protein ACA29_01505 [Lederbergia galactosidilytica]|uniref:Heat shock protein 70 n=1 Tax=Lederbergia galactosidilytica TaxID=217031 RepID=A0A0Q9Y7Z0_9BACI|nr:hypothetical protein ACA29_01505 [Lederbergia galactosidilytica]
MDVTEGEDEDPEYIKIIGTSTIQLPSGLPMSSPIEITISYDKNGIVHTRAKDLFNDIDLGEMVIERQSNLTQQEFEVKKETLLSIEVE